MAFAYSLGRYPFEARTHDLLLSLSWFEWRRFPVSPRDASPALSSCVNGTASAARNFDEPVGTQRWQSGSRFRVPFRYVRRMERGVG